MTSNFEEALARAAADREWRKKAAMEQQRRLAEQSDLARSIIDPYLDDLGPKAVVALLDLGVPMVVHKDRYGHSTGCSENCWAFISSSDSDSGDKEFVLHASGRFGSFLSEGKLQPIQVGLISGNDVVFGGRGYSRHSTFWASLDDQKVHVNRTYDEYRRNLQELSEFMAQYIHGVMRR